MTDVPHPLVSVVIVHYNGATMLGACLRSVFAQPYRPMQVIVVDNGSTDGSVDLLRSEFQEAILLPQGRNLGFAEGNNVGVNAAAGEYVLLLNNDTEVTPGWIPPLLDRLNDPGVGAVTSRVVTDGVPAEFYTMNGSVNALGYNIMRVFDDLSAVFFAGGASLMFRKSDYPEPFPPEYFLYQEDVYLSWRVRLGGRSVCMAQESVVYHRGSATTRRQTSASVTFYQERNRCLNALGLYQGWTLLRLAPLASADALAKLALSLVARRKSFWGILRAYAWCLFHPGWILRFRARHQRERRVSDREILRWMSSRIVAGEGRASRFINSVWRLYARAVGLRFYD